MGRWLSDRPTLRGFLIIVLIALVVVILNLYTALSAIGMLMRIAFFLAVAFFIYLVWRERRSDIETWSTRAKAAFYGAAILIVADVAFFIVDRPSGRNALAFFLVLIICGFAMFRVWRDQHSYSL
jgi:hypothetical protein